MEKWRNGEMEKWRNGEMEKWVKMVKRKTYLGLPGLSCRVSVF
jgi:hypothetical protein